ncbi:hypothetical protein NH340_JMT06988 [Sarcoptes scabiei]|nr:hypothetical protein NH340_JMT06988 [Sarcoptes scabiei]
MLKCLKKPLFKWQEFNSKTLESILIEMFGPNRSLSDIFLNHNKHLILCTAIVDSNPARLQLIDHNINGNLSLWKACRVSGASVGLYKTYDLDGSPYFDGSLVASNPTIDILGYCHEIFQSQCRDRSDKDWNRIDSILNQSNDSNESIHSINFVLSIGAGKLRSVENFQPIDSIAFTANLKKYFDYYRQLRNWFVSILTETDDWIVERSKYFTLTQRIDYARLNCFYDRERAKQSLIELNKIIGFDWEYFHEDSETEQDENEDEKDIDDQEDFRESNNTQSNGSNEKRSKTIDSKTISRIKSLKNLRKNKIKIASNCRRNRYRKQLKNLRQKQLESLKQIRTDQLLLQILWETHCWIPVPSYINGNDGTRALYLFEIYDVHTIENIGSVVMVMDLFILDRILAIV